MRDAYAEFTRQFFDRWSPLYDLYAAPIAFAYRAAVRRAGAGPGRSILDLCTGTGEIARRAAARGARVTALDRTPSMLARAERKTRGRDVAAVLGDARALPFADLSFDACVLSFALHDMPRKVRTEVLREALRVARERLVILDYDVPRSGPARAPVLAFLETFETPYLAHFSRAGIRGALEEAGLAATGWSRPLPGLIALAEVRP